VLTERCAQQRDCPAFAYTASPSPDCAGWGCY